MLLENALFNRLLLKVVIHTTHSSQPSPKGEGILNINL